MENSKEKMFIFFTKFKIPFTKNKLFPKIFFITTNAPAKTVLKFKKVKNKKKINFLKNFEFIEESDFFSQKKIQFIFILYVNYLISRVKNIKLLLNIDKLVTSPNLNKPHLEITILAQDLIIKSLALRAAPTQQITLYMQSILISNSDSQSI